MIVEGIISSLINLVLVVISILPDWQLPDEVLTAFTSAGSILSAFDFILPVATIITILSIMSSFYLSLVTMKIVLFAYSFIRGSIRYDI